MSTGKVVSIIVTIINVTKRCNNPEEKNELQREDWIVLQSKICGMVLEHPFAETNILNRSCE